MGQKKVNRLLKVFILAVFMLSAMGVYVVHADGGGGKIVSTGNVYVYHFWEWNIWGCDKSNENSCVIVKSN